MEIKLVLIDLIEMAINIIEVLQSLAQHAFPRVRKTTFYFVPHALQIMNIETLVFSTILAEESHGFLCLFELVISNHVAR
jgi:hypothetical protein